MPPTRATSEGVPRSFRDGLRVTVASPTPTVEPAASAMRTVAGLPPARRLMVVKDHSRPCASFPPWRPARPLGTDTVTVSLAPKPPSGEKVARYRAGSYVTLPRIVPLFEPRTVMAPLPIARGDMGWSNCTTTSGASDALRSPAGGHAETIFGGTGFFASSKSARRVNALAFATAPV